VKIRVPGDKSISQRGLILSALAQGESRLRGLLPGGDPASTAGALRGLGVGIPGVSEWGGEVRIQGRGLRGLESPTLPLDLENSGTGARLLMGVLAGQPFEAVVTGDESLRRRPMGRITDPLSQMGATFESLEDEGRLPILVRGGQLEAFHYDLPVASAQVKSSLLLAGLVGGVSVSLTEPGRSRDHTEGMFRAGGVPVQGEPHPRGWSVFLPGGVESLQPLELEVPGDISSAAFFLILGLLRGGGDPLVLEGVGLNATRTALLPVLERMGARFHIENLRGEDQGEPLGNIVVEGSDLQGTEVGGHEIPGMIDEIPILAVAASQASGRTVVTGARELRVKETDRIQALVQNFRSLGVKVEELEDGLEIQGSDAPLDGTVRSFGDHRIAMAFGVLGSLPGNRIDIDDPGVTDVSFPGFWETLERVDMKEDKSAPGRGSDDLTRPPVITLDGPAGSGKSTTAKEVARRLAFQHLDSGALYRALTYALLSSEIPEEEWENLTQEELDAFPIRVENTPEGLRVFLGDQLLISELRTPEVTAKTSPVSAFPAVRAWLLEAQRRTGKDGALVADGRDMGSVVFPDAEVKIYLTADLMERARRRFLEREGRAPTPEDETLEAKKIQERDTRDSGRAVAPLKKPEGALEVDTSELTFEGQVEVIINHVKALTDK
jgi:3-phosphoshikimate 1-carboxyvinyltransferase